MRRVSVFCGSSTGHDSRYRASAERLADVMVARRIDLVYGGGRVGLMGVIADAIASRGGHVIGVIPHALVAKEVAHQRLADLRVVGSMHERKATMARLADVFIALPGGFGTFEEIFEAITWTQLGLHAKRCGVLNVDGYFDGLLTQLDRAVAEGFLRPDNRRLLEVAEDPAELLDRLAAPMVAPQAKWIRSVDEA